MGIAGQAVQVRNHDGAGADTSENLACACVEALTRSLAGEVGHLKPLLDDTLTGRLPRLSEVAGTATFLASDQAGAITAAILNLTCGAIID